MLYTLCAVFVTMLYILVNIDQEELKLVLVILPSKKNKLALRKITLH